MSLLGHLLTFTAAAFCLSACWCCIRSYRCVVALFNGFYRDDLFVVVISAFAFPYRLKKRFMMAFFGASTHASSLNSRRSLRIGSLP